MTSGYNWKVSCDEYGSPGTESITNCSNSICTFAQCEAYGANDIEVESDNTCDCDAETNYYSDPNGCACVYGIY